MNLVTYFTRITVLHRQNITQLILQIVLTIRVTVSSIFVNPLCGLCGPATSTIARWAVQQRTATTGPVRSSVVIMLTSSSSLALASGRPTAITGSAGGQCAVLPGEFSGGWPSHIFLVV